jgi:hypothetical protein
MPTLKIRNNEAQLTAFSPKCKGAITPPFLWFNLRRTIVKTRYCSRFLFEYETMDVRKKKPAAGNWQLFSVKATEH